MWQVLCTAAILSVDALLLGIFVLAGNTYERENITSWLRTNNTDPLTNEHMSSKKLVPNLTLRSAIAEWRMAHALPADEQSDTSTSSGDEQASTKQGGASTKLLAKVKRRDTKGKTRRSKNGDAPQFSGL